MTENRRLASLIAEEFPDEYFYLGEVSFESVFGDTPFKEVIGKLAEDDKLARHLLCSPDYLVLSRSRDVNPETGAFYIRVFDDEIELSDWERETYRLYYPAGRLLLYAPLKPSYIWLSDFLDNKKSTSGRFSS